MIYKCHKNKYKTQINWDCTYFWVLLVYWIHPVPQPSYQYMWKCNNASACRTQVTYPKNSNSGNTISTSLLQTIQPFLTLQPKNCANSTNKGKSESKVPFFFTQMEVSGDKKSIWMSFNISPLFFHRVSKLVHTLVITY
jgi:hypothetical protein